MEKFPSPLLKNFLWFPTNKSSKHYYKDREIFSNQGNMVLLLTPHPFHCNKYLTLGVERWSRAQKLLYCISGMQPAIWNEYKCCWSLLYCHYIAGAKIWTQALSDLTQYFGHKLGLFDPIGSTNSLIQQSDALVMINSSKWSFLELFSTEAKCCNICVGARIPLKSVCWLQLISMAIVFMQGLHGS